MERIEGVDRSTAATPSGRCPAVSGNSAKLKNAQKKRDEEHHLAGDEEQSCRSAGRGARPACAAPGVAAFPDHVAPPEEHRGEHEHRAEDQHEVVAEMRGEDDAEHGADRRRARRRSARGSGRPDDTAASGRELCGNRGAVRVAAHAESIPVLPGKPPRHGWPHHPQFPRAFKGVACPAVHAAWPTCGPALASAPVFAASSSVRKKV